MRSSLLLLVSVLAACGPGEAACRAACERPFELAEATTASKAQVWSQFPEPQRTQALEIRATWQATTTAAKAQFASECIPECRRTDDATADCMKRAQNFADWKACGSAAPAR